jgi:DNA-binding IclR family transcriptional regulator
MAEKMKSKKVEMSGEQQSGTQAANRLIDILEYVGSSSDEVNASDISASVGLPKSTVSRLLSVLVSRGWILRTGRGELSLSMKVVEVAGTVRLRHVLEEAQGELRELRDRTGETSVLAVFEGFEVIYLASVESDSSLLHAQARRWGRYPAHCTATGKVLLAALDPNGWERYSKIANLEARTSRTVTAIRALEKELETVQERGYAVDEGEFEEGLWCVSAPVKFADTTVAAIGVSVPDQRVGDRAEMLIRDTADAAVRISDRVARVADSAASR